MSEISVVDIDSAIADLDRLVAARTQHEVDVLRGKLRNRVAELLETASPKEERRREPPPGARGATT